jgi:prepilin-type N-terminal cleavage/methylation domain-containing protein
MQKARHVTGPEGHALGTLLSRSGIEKSSGFTLVELLVAISILSLIMTSFYHLTSTTLSLYSLRQDKQELLARGCFTLDRIMRFVEETDKIDRATERELRITERLLDTYNNENHPTDPYGYVPEGDGFLDADNDADGVVNEGGADKEELIKFKLDENTGLLHETQPDYSTGDDDDYLDQTVICEHVTLFDCSKLGTNVVEIRLTLDDGRAQVALKTRVRAKYVE